MTCPRCQADNRDGVRFCEHCGGPLHRTCARCGGELVPHKRFCGACGAPAGAAPDPRYASPEGYTPRHLAEKILTSRAALEGERKQVTVLFADLKSSMELLADRDPEDARRILDPVLERMMEAVHRFEGTVNQVLGDGIMALFGAPVAHEDHAVRACYAALRIQEGVRDYAEEVRRVHGVPVHVRVGLNSGEVVVRSIGNDLHMDYTAVGQTTHLAARMEQLATPGVVLATAHVARLAEGYVALRSIGPVPVRGLPEPLEVFAITGAGAARTRLQALSVRGLSRFVGRDVEIARLEEALARARESRGQVVAVVGEAGVGKSRLYWEFVHSLRTRDWLVLETGAVSYGKTTSYLPVIELLRGYFRLGDRDDQREVREKIVGKLLTLDRALEAAVPAFLALLDVPVTDAPWQAMEPQQRRQRTLDALKGLFLRESRVQPLLLLFEDLHWADSETQALLDALIEGLPTARILLLLNYRHEYQHAWGGRSYYTQLRLDPLPAETAETLLEALVGADPSLEALKRLLIEQTEGNPFFLEETVRTLAESHVLEGKPGAYRLTRALPAIRVPSTVQAVLGARIDRLPPDEKRLLQCAAVIGKDVPGRLLTAVADLPESTIREALGHLMGAEFLYETRLFPDLEYAFRHALTHEVAYASLLTDRRRALHARILEALEQMYPDRPAEQVERLGHHALRGEVWDRALGYLRQAGDKAAARSAKPEAATYYEQALATLGQLPENRATLEQAIDLRISLHHVLLLLGELGRAHALLREAETLAERLDDEIRRVRAACYLTNHLWIAGDLRAARETIERARTITGSLDHPTLRAAANYYLAQVCHSEGDYTRAIALCRDSIEGLAPTLDPAHFARSAFFVYAHAWLAWCLAETGNFAAGRPSAETVFRLSRAVDRPDLWVATCLGIGNYHLRRGTVEEAVPLLERGVELCTGWELPLWFAPIGASLGHAYTLAGRLDEALATLDEAVRYAVGRGVLVYHALWVAYQAEAYLASSRPERALALAREALDLARRYGERGHEAWALRVLAAAAGRLGADHAEEARGAARQAVGLAERLAMAPMVARCRVELGLAESRAGDLDAARRELGTAVRDLRTLGMTRWLVEAEAELSRLRPA